ncbi:MAG: hypothetical protein HC882_05135, partial [Acidobacteria bacterium]|nr:hypothetical protein [Acidobacteriota bacterium]
MTRCSRPACRVPPDLGDGEGQPQHWHLPRGTAALGRLLAGGDSRFGGPVLTTNFDPLLSMAVEVAGGCVDRRVLSRDGHLPDPGDSRHGPRIIHLHGFWRGSTLHLPHHLTAPRPKLLGSLRELLAGHTVLVAAYGGWQDAFMQALSEVIDSRRPMSRSSGACTATKAAPGTTIGSYSSASRVIRGSPRTTGS